MTNIEKLARAVDNFLYAFRVGKGESAARIAMFEALDEYKASQDPDGPLGTQDQD